MSDQETKQWILDELELRSRIKALEARLAAAADIIADAIANHESGDRCSLNLPRAAVWLANYESAQ